MAKEILTNVEIKLGGLDISNYCKSISMEDKIDQVESTCFGDDARTYVTSFVQWSGTIDGINDLQIIEPLLESIRTSTVPYSATLSVLPKKGTPVSASNVKKTGVVKFTSLPLFSASIAELPPMNLSFNGSGKVTRLTS